MRKVMLFVLLIAFNSNAQIISEICPSNHQVLEPTPGWFPDWLEIYNNTAFTIDLTGYGLTDDRGNPEKWAFIIGEIMPGDFFVVKAEKNNPDPTVVSFAFNKKGETIYLVNPEGVIIDSVAFPNVETNHSYGRIEDKWYFFDQPTPGLFNWTETGYNGYATAPDFSMPTGTYPPGTMLYIFQQDSEGLLYYSLNGTNPLESQIYSEPLLLNETITVTLVARGDSLLDSPPIRKTYFVNEPEHALPIVNLCVDSLMLFDEVFGICMPGPEAEDEFPFEGANYWGDEKVNAWFQYFDADFRLVEELPMEIKIHGGAGSRIRPMKSFQMRTKSGTFEANYFEEKPGKQYERLLLRNSGNDFCNTCIKDGTIHNYLIQNDLDVDLLAFSPVVVYINGNYHGVQNVREKVDRYYLAANYDVSPESVNILEGRYLVPVEGSNDEFEEVLDYVELNDLSNESHYNWVANRVDVQSMIDYFIIELYVNNRDWPNNNLKLWNSPDQPLWRYLCYDLDVAFRYTGDTPEDRESLRYILDHLVEENPHVFLFHQLLQNQEFRNYFINRYADLMNTTFEPEVFFSTFLREQRSLEVDMPAHYTKWCGPLAQWNQRFFGVKGFIDTRQAIVRDELISVFAQNGVADIVVDIYPYNSGTVRLNTLTVESFPFSGTYFNGTEIKLKAQPHPLKTFLYWQNARTGEKFYGEDLHVNPESGDRFVAVFDDGGSIFDLVVVPNPVGSMLNLRFSLPAESEVKFTISDSRGTYSKSLNDIGRLPLGNHFFTRNLVGLASGIYVLTIQADYGSESVQFYKL